MTTENKITPPNVRPYHPAHKTGDERITHTTEKPGWRRQVWRQIGWHGQSGAFYSLAEDPSRYEPGSFGPLWLLVDDEPVILPDDAGERS